jgi:hypothetical protein
LLASNGLRLPSRLRMQASEEIALMGIVPPV